MAYLLLRHIEVTTNGHLEGNLAKEREAGSSEMRLLIRSDGDDCDDDDHHDDDDDDDDDGDGNGNGNLNGNEDSADDH